MCFVCNVSVICPLFTWSENSSLLITKQLICIVNVSHLISLYQHYLLFKIISVGLNTYFQMSVISALSVMDRKKYFWNIWPTPALRMNKYACTQQIIIIIIIKQSFKNPILYHGKQCVDLSTKINETFSQYVIIRWPLIRIKE